MIRDPISLIQYEAKRNPKIAKLIENIGDVTEQEINEAKLKMPWMRKALLQLKSLQGNPSLAAFMEKFIVDGFVSDSVGETRQWIGGNTFITMGKNQIEIRAGQLLWSDGKGVWFDTIHSNKIDSRIVPNTKPCGTMTRMDYMQMIRDRARGLDTAPTTITNGSQQGLNSSVPFTIYRI